MLCSAGKHVQDEKTNMIWDTFQVVKKPRLLKEKESLELSGSVDTEGDQSDLLVNVYKAIAIKPCV